MVIEVKGARDIVQCRMIGGILGQNFAVLHCAFTAYSGRINIVVVGYSKCFTADSSSSCRSFKSLYLLYPLLKPGS
jgi:hypothetical protein